MGRVAKGDDVGTVLAEAEQRCIGRLPLQRRRRLRAIDARRARRRAGRQQQPFAAPLRQYEIGHGAARHIAADDVLPGGIARRDGNALAPALAARLRQHGTSDGGLGERVAQAGAACGKEEREGVGERQASAAAFGGNQRVGIAEGVDGGPLLGGCLARFAAAHRVVGAQVRERALEAFQEGISHGVCPFVS
ncbi:hypothetical protein D9M68_721200 [compost metagenome]